MNDIYYPIINQATVVYHAVICLGVPSVRPDYHGWKPLLLFRNQGSDDRIQESELGL